MATSRCIILVIAGLLVFRAPQTNAVDVSFAFTFDSSYTSNAGSQLLPSENDFIFVGNYISSIIKPSFNGNAVIHINVSGLNNPSTNVLASASGYTFTSAGFNPDLAQAAVQFNYVNNQGYPEAIADMNFAWNWGYGGNVASNQIDFRQVILHELFHAIGFQSNVDANGISQIAPLAYSYFDYYLQGWDGAQYVNLITRDANDNPTGVMANAAAALTDNAHPVLFTGPNVMAYLGQPAPLYTPSTWQSGSSISHYNYPGQLEYYAISGYGPLYNGFSGLDMAFLKDLGYVVVPEPSTYALAVVSSLVIILMAKKSPRNKVSRTV